MSMAFGSDEYGEKALAELCRLISGRLLHDTSFVDDGLSLEFHGGAEDFAEKVFAAVSQSIEDVSKDQMLAILMRKTRTAMREIGEKVLVDDELPTGFSSN